MSTSFPTNLPAPTDSAPYIVIGSGVAGLYTALELSKERRVILITKSALMESNTNYAQGGIAAAMGVPDSPELHYQDTMMAGAGLCNSEAVLALVYDGPEQVRRLIALGTPFDRVAGQIALTREAAHSRPRILHADGDATGHAVSATLVSLARRQPNITIYEHHYTLALVLNNSRCCGAVTVHQGQVHLFLSAAVVLCTGGLGQIYGKTTNPSIATGDGMVLAYNAGAELCDLEFIQFHPTALHLQAAPPFLISETVRGEGAFLLNQSGHRFMPDYHPLAELAPRDVVARAIFAEIQKTAATYVNLDLSRIPTATIRSRFPNIYETCFNYGLDITAQPIPVAPAAHYMMGGVLTDLQGQTKVPGLYAAGEVASTGVHGANRLASNSLLEGLVFGNRAARALLEKPAPIPEATLDLQVCYPRLNTDYANLKNDLTQLHHLTGQYLGIVREASGIATALASLDSDFRAEVTQLTPDPQYLEFQNMLQLTRLIFQAALARTESRGGHYRADYPEPSNAWRKHLVFHDAIMEVRE
ncbi:MAG: L-aspartate oxidase [Bacillota bacterium]|jgi:L-aspartate oxidase